MHLNRNHSPKKMNDFSSRFKNLSNAFFLIPVVVALYFRGYVFGSIVFISTITSFLYHLSRERSYLRIDSFFAYAMMLMNLVIFVIVGFGNLFIWSGVFLVLISLFLHFTEEDNYNFNHALWHLTSSLATSLFIIAFYSR